MHLFKLHKFTLAWLFFFIPLLSFLVFKKTFNLALYGDDWLQLYNLWISFDVQKSLSFFDIRSYLGAYWPQYLFLGVIRHFFGYQPQAYFAASLLLKIIATISLFFLVKNLSKSMIASYLATLIFTLSAAGLQTTDWVFNMNTYAGIFFLNLSFIVYLKLHTLKSFFSLYHLLFILFFIIALGVVPVRMHGAIPFLLATELFLWAFGKKATFKIDKFLLARVTIPLLVMFILVKVGSFGGEGDILPLLKNSLVDTQNTLSQGKYDILFYFFGIIGNTAIPDTINLGTFFNHSLPRFLFFTVIGLFISYGTGSRKKVYLFVATINLFWVVISKMLTIWNPALSMNNLFSISIGFQIVILSLLIFKEKRESHPNLSVSIIIGLLWVILFSLLYWLKTPYFIIETTGRYMTMGALGFAIIFASILSIIFANFRIAHKTNPIYLIILAITFGSWLYTNYLTTQSYLSNLETSRNLTLADNTWGSLLKSVPTLNEEGPSIFYFTYDNHSSANMILVFGFSPHAGLSYKISSWEKTPVPTEDYLQLLDMVKTGEPMKKIHARDYQPVPIERVFAFDLRDGKLTDITDSIRLKLTKDIENSITTTPTQ